MKQFVKALSVDGECFQHLICTFPGLSYKKIKGGVFNGPQIRTLVHDQGFPQTMNDKEKAARLSFVYVTKNFLGNKKAQNYENLVSNVLSAFHHLGCKMSIKVHFLFSHLNKFPENVGSVTDEQERWDCHLLADYSWSIQRDCPEKEYKRKSTSANFCHDTSICQLICLSASYHAHTVHN